MFEINCRRKLNLIKLKDIYYASKAQREHPGYDVVYYFNCRQHFGKAKEFKTAMVYLGQEPEDILGSFSKKTRAQVKKGLSNNKLTFKICEHPAAGDLDRYCSAYDSFALQKNILPCHRELLEKAYTEDRLIIASASTGGEILCQFVLIELEYKLVCYHGFNVRFDCLEDIEKVKLISQANRALEYRCMLYAKDNGKLYYDLCGLTMDPDNHSASNVDHYKKGFRGEITTEYHFLQPITALGILFSLLVHLRQVYLSLTN